MNREVMDGLLDKLLDDKFLGFIDNFTAMHCQQFRDDEEYTLKQTEIHGQYKRMYESRVESHLKGAGVTFAAFVEGCKELIMEDETYGIFVESLAAVDDFEAFCQMMRERRPEGL